MGRPQFYANIQAQARLLQLRRVRFRIDCPAPPASGSVRPLPALDKAPNAAQLSMPFQCVWAECHHKSGYIMQLLTVEWCGKSIAVLITTPRAMWQGGCGGTRARGAGAAGRP